MSHNTRQFRFVREILYSLKREYGTQADLYHIISITQDVKTGKKIVNKIKYTIKRAILLPTILKRQMAVELGFRATSTLGTPPGFDTKERLIILDNKDLPKDFEIGTSDYLVIDHERHDLKSIDALEHNQATLLTTKVIEGGETNEITNTKVKQSLSFSQLTSITKAHRANNALVFNQLTSLQKIKKRITSQSLLFNQLISLNISKLKQSLQQLQFNQVADVNLNGAAYRNVSQILNLQQQTLINRFGLRTALQNLVFTQSAIGTLGELFLNESGFLVIQTTPNPYSFGFSFDTPLLFTGLSNNYIYTLSADANSILLNNLEVNYSNNQLDIIVRGN